MKLRTHRLIKPTRRALIGGLGLVIASPAIVRATSMLLTGVGGGSSAGPTFQQGIYFRSTNNQTSPPNYDVEFSGAVANYPRTSAQGHTVGWETAGLQKADRDVTADVRLKGIYFFAQTAPQQYRIDLPAAGTYKFRLAMGDSGFRHPHRFQIVDNATLLQSTDFADTVLADQWGDATGVVRTSESAWVSNNGILTLTFSSTICRFVFGSSTGTSDTNETVNALFVSN
jgi:hypothetical protein